MNNNNDREIATKLRTLLSANLMSLDANATRIIERAADLIEEETDAVQDLAQLRKDYAGLLMELELERGRVKSLKATVVNQAEHITHLTALNISAEHDRAIHAARDGEYDNDNELFF